MIKSKSPAMGRRYIFMLWLGIPFLLLGQEPRFYNSVKTDLPPQIDGRLDDAAWRVAPWTEDFVDIEGAGKPLPRFRTRAKILWDDEYLYIGAELEEPNVRATLTEHDSVIFHDNDFEVFFDPTGTAANYFEFEINALNTSWDLFLDKPYRFGGKADNGWEVPGLKSAVAIDGTLNDASDIDRGWTVELAFPWKAFGALPNHAWRINFSRVEWRYPKLPNAKEDNWVWSAQAVVNMHIPERWGTVRFVVK